MVYPQALIQLFTATASFLSLCYKDPLVKLLVRDFVNFKGSGIIDESEVRHLHVSSKTDEENFLSNFILGDLRLVLHSSPKSK